MKNIIVKAFNEEHGTNYSSLESICADYSPREVFSSWLENEGIIGYTSEILEVLSVLWFL